MFTYNTTTYFFIIIIFFATLGAFATVMTSQDHNEHMYITSSVLYAQGGALYQDFAYLQTPYLPLLYGSVYQLFDMHSNYLLIGKLFSFLSLSISALSLFLIGYRISKNLNFALCAVALFLLNMSIIYPAFETSNYIMPLAMSLVAFYLFDKGHDPAGANPLLITIAGFLLALAVGTKLTYASAILPYLTYIFLRPFINHTPSSAILTAITRTVLPFGIGLLLGMLPILYFVFEEPTTFMFNNWGYHSLNATWRKMTDFDGPVALFSKLAFARSQFFKPENTILLLCLLFGIAISRFPTQTTHKLPHGAVLAFLLFTTAVATALAPTPSFHQYYAYPISFLFILFLYTYAIIPTHIYFYFKKLLVVATFIALTYNGPEHVMAIKDLTSRHNWSPLYFSDISRQIRKELETIQEDENNKIATLSPLFAIESNLPIYNELATGPFLYRVGNLLDEAQCEQYVGVSPKRLGELFQEDPPVAIIVGFEDEAFLEEPLIAYAQLKNYEMRKIKGFVGKVYFRP